MMIRCLTSVCLLFYLLGEKKYIPQTLELKYHFELRVNKVSGNFDKLQLCMVGEHQLNFIENYCLNLLIGSSRDIRRHCEYFVDFFLCKGKRLISQSLLYDLK